MKPTRPDIDALLATLADPSLNVIEPGLERVSALLAALGHPEHNLPPVIHIAGTNGKGSLAAYLSAIFAEAGLRAHRYISPHLTRFNERITLAGADITDDALFDVLTRVKAQLSAHPVTFFEATTAAAFLAFAEHPADVMILETGMGGRLDATNMVASPALTAITPVAMDHAEYLGGTLACIAAEKAGIIKQNVPCIIGPQQPEALHVLLAASVQQSAPVFIHGRDWSVETKNGAGVYRSKVCEIEYTPSLPGAHQLHNAGTAIACAEYLPQFGIAPALAVRAVARAAWPARLQELRGRLIHQLPPGSRLWLDGGHNPHAGAAIAQWAQGLPAKLYLICGMVEGKDSAAYLAALAPHATFLHAVAIPGEPTSQPAASIAVAAAQAGIPQVAQPSVEAALAAIAKGGGKPLVLICGSLYLAGKVLLMDSFQPDEKP